MNTSNKSIIILALLFSLISIDGFSQNTTYDSLKLITATKEIITKAHTCALITLDNEGRSRVRMIETLPIDDDFTLWFGTNPRSRKVEQIKNDARVTVYYADATSTGYVMIQGKAILVNESAEKEKHWKDGWQSYYPNKEKDFVLIKVIPESLEIVSYMHGIMGDSETWEPAIIHLNTPH